ncbi:MAG: glycosyltransferase [Dissulfurispiraceae bacterium]|jgi:glycosyltransferase involved in cell wall biosynthesis|nr:glycosyltransferase [Dissulfurispiraceae bacterium]
MKTKITVLMPCFNAERFLRNTLESVLSQKYDDFRVIVTDDGSNDNTAAILEDYSDRITILKHADNRNHGQAAALNLGLLNTESEYIAFIDADDIWHPDKLAKQAAILDQFEDIGLVYTNGNVINSVGKELYSMLDSQHVETNERGSILFNCYIRTPSTVMVRREALLKAGMFKKDMLAADHDMWIRMHEITKFYYMPEKLAGYREHSAQISRQKAITMWEDGLKVLNMAYRRYPYPASLIRKRRAVIYYRFGECALKNKNYASAAMYFIRTFINDPLRSVSELKNIL